METAELEGRQLEALATNKRWLVEQGDEIGKKAKENKDWKSQIRSILEAARDETEPRVLLNFLRYQSVRNKNWREPVNVSEPLGRQLQGCIDRSREDNTLALVLMQHLLCYAYRSYTYETGDRSHD